MNAIIEIDKSGRIVVPKKLRDALHLKPGTRMHVERAGEALLLVPSLRPAQLVIENGVPLVVPADRAHAPALTNEMVNSLLEEGRRERALHALDMGEESE